MSENVIGIKHAREYKASTKEMALASDLVWDFLDAVQSSNVIQRIDGRRQSSMKTENLQQQQKISHDYRSENYISNIKATSQIT